MRRLQQIAYVILFAGWIVPAMLAKSASASAAPRSPMELLTGAESSAPADQIVVFLRVVAGIWFLVALIYAVVLALRLRRTLI